MDKFWVLLTDRCFFFVIIREGSIRQVVLYRHMVVII